MKAREPTPLGERGVKGGCGERVMRHPVTGRYMAGDCERDCLEHCAGLCSADAVELHRKD